MHTDDLHRHSARGTWRTLSDVVVHCFTGNRDELHDYLALDCHIGITGWICDERRGTHMKEFLKDIPANRLMIETDAPYLKPRNLRPRVKSHRNEPRWLPWILGTLAAARDETSGVPGGTYHRRMPAAFSGSNVITGHARPKSLPQGVSGTFCRTIIAGSALSEQGCLERVLTGT